MKVMPETRTVKVMRVGHDQIIEIPEDWEFPDGEVTISKSGDALVITQKMDDSTPADIASRPLD